MSKIGQIFNNGKVSYIRFLPRGIAWSFNPLFQPIDDFYNFCFAKPKSFRDMIGLSRAKKRIGSRDSYIFRGSNFIVYWA
jgi:hypothetical protein